MTISRKVKQQTAEIRARLVLARVQAGLSQGQVANLLGLAGTGSTVSQWEQGGRGLHLERFLELCALYGVSPVWVLTGVNPDFDATEILRAASDASDDLLRMVDLLSSLDREPMTGGTS